MKQSKSHIFILLAVAFCIQICGTASGLPWFSVDSEEQWNHIYPGLAAGNHVEPMDDPDWYDYMQHWGVPSYGPPDPNVVREGDPYPENEYIVPELLVYPGSNMTSDSNYPEDAGLVMAWGLHRPDAEPLPEGSYSAAWTMVYGEDPDLRNCIIKVTVTPPCDPGITTVSFAIEDNGLPVRRMSWQWNVPGTIPCDKSTTVIIDTSKYGQNAATPRADGFAVHKNFRLDKSTAFNVDENGKWIFGPVPVPPPGFPQFVGLWNYWHNLVVLPKPTEGKYFIKWSQPPVPVDPNHPTLFNAWDEWSDYNDIWIRQIIADDWLCEDDRPITDIHWWGSWEGWDQPHLPPIVPKAFHIGIWTDVPKGPDNPVNYSHPGKLIWENYCDNWVWNFAGYDKFPWEEPHDPVEPHTREANFQFNQLLSQDEWFKQEPNDLYDDDPNKTIYWLSIAAIYNPWDYDNTQFRLWGWKTRPHFFQDDAVRIHSLINVTGLDTWPPHRGDVVRDAEPIYWPDPCDTWDMSFELSTNKPAPEPNDTNAPDPDPAEWELLPEKIGSIAIRMTAKTATDPSGPIGYFFAETSGNPGGDNSGWQSSTGYVDVGLDPNTTYQYKVRAKDALGNMTAWSTTEAETTAPICADLYKDVNDIIDSRDYDILAGQWLESCP
ncbi:MAG: DUF7901 domain-containing protein [Planctomycetota bacterium]|jgi:hypothetical protein